MGTGEKDVLSVSTTSHLDTVVRSGLDMRQ